jgi:hypothetical protein
MHKVHIPGVDTQCVYSTREVNLCCCFWLLKPRDSLVFASLCNLSWLVQCSMFGSLQFQRNIQMNRTNLHCGFPQTKDYSQTLRVYQSDCPSSFTPASLRSVFKSKGHSSSVDFQFIAPPTELLPWDGLLLILFLQNVLDTRFNCQHNITNHKSALSKFRVKVICSIHRIWSLTNPFPF